MGIFKKKYYCHKCGDILYRNPNTRVITHKDPEWKKFHRGYLISVGKMTITEYDLKCLTCRTTIDYEKQKAIAEIQNKLNKNILTDEEFNEYKDEIDNIIAKKQDTTKKIYGMLAVILAIIIFIFNLKK